MASDDYILFGVAEGADMASAARKLKTFPPFVGMGGDSPSDDPYTQLGRLLADCVRILRIDPASDQYKSTIEAIADTQHLVRTILYSLAQDAYANQPELGLDDE